MRSRSKLTLAAAALALAAAGAGIAGTGSGGDARVASAEAATAPAFSNPRAITNAYLPLSANRRCEYRGVDEDGTKTRSVLTLLERTKRFVVGGTPVDVAVIRDNAYEGGKLVETTLDYFAQADDGTVYYFGEDVQNVKNGKILNRGGTWLYGEDTDVLGVAMPARPDLAVQYRFEDVPGITYESNRVEEVGMRARVAGKLHTGVIRIQEFIQPEGEVEYKLYAPGVGKIIEYAPTSRSELRGCS